MALLKCFFDAILQHQTLSSSLLVNFNFQAIPTPTFEEEKPAHHKLGVGDPVILYNGQENLKLAYALHILQMASLRVPYVAKLIEAVN